MIVRVGRDDSARPAPAPAEADSPCQGEMSQRDKRGRDRQAPRKTPPPSFYIVFGDLVGAAPRGRPQAHSVCPPRHSEAPEGPWESVFLAGGTDIATSGLRPSSQ